MTTGGNVRLGLRERKKQETREALSLATIRLSVERGWDNVTIEDIAAAANVSVRTFRNYFSNKAEAVAARHVERTVRIAEVVRARPADEPLWDAISGVVLAEYGAGDTSAADSSTDHRSNPDGLRLMLAEPALQGEIIRASAAAQSELAQAIAERTGTDVARDVYPTLVAATVGTITAVAIQHCLSADSSIPIAPVLRDLFAQVIAGLPVP